MSRAQHLRTPGVYLAHTYPQPETERLPTGVPAFLGIVEPRYKNQSPGPAWRITRWLQFTDQFKNPETYLATAVHGFFANGGRLCYVVPLNDAFSSVQQWSEACLQAKLDDLATLDTIDLVCAPGLVLSPDAVALQWAILTHCEAMNNRFAILDALPDTDVLEQRKQLVSDYGALYYPWIGIRPLPVDDRQPGQATPAVDLVQYVPPCGHIAGVYARSDEQIGVHKAPANELLEGVLSLHGPPITDVVQGPLNEQSVNCLRSFPRRGIRVWGARSLSHDPKRRYINVQRLLITVARWIEREMADVVFEPNNPQLWQRIDRQLTAYFDSLVRAGALKGSAEEPAFAVNCSAETNPDEVRATGQIITEIRLAPTVPGEFIEVRIIHGLAGVTIAGPGQLRLSKP